MSPAARRPDDPVPGSLFVCGMLRSGTTLLDKVLNMHPQLTVGSQPFFGFYTACKLAYLSGAGQQAVPFTPQFRERAGLRAGFRDWLEREVLGDGLLREIGAHCTEAKGQGAPSLRGRDLRLVPGHAIDVWRQLHRGLMDVYGIQRPDGYVGSKEVLCEEFAPYLADSGVKCLMSVRDPRAVIASLNGGSYRKSVGDTYPILMNIRNWRKSVAYLLQLQDHANAMGLRYEDLAGDGPATLQRIAGFLGVRDFDDAWYAGGLRDQEGQPWAGNSSFGAKGKLDASGLENWRRLLDPATVRFIEFCTYPELRALGYAVNTDSWDPEALRGYREDPAQLRQGYIKDYGITQASLADELMRRDLLLAEPPPRDDIEPLFIFETAYRRLRAAVT